MTRLISILCSLTLLGPATAQEGTSMTGRFLVFPKSADETPVTLLLGAEKQQEIEMTTGRFSDPYTVTGMTKWVIGKPGVDKEGKPTFETWGSCNSVGGKNQSVLLFRKGANNEDGFNMIAFENSDSGFGKGKFLVFNATSSEVAGQIGKQQFIIKPAGRTIVKPVADLEENLCFSTFSVKVNDKWVPISSSNWPLAENARGLVFIYGDPATQKFLVHAVRDYL